MDFDDEEERDEERRATTRQNLTSTRSLPTVSGVKPEGQGSEAKGRRRRQMVRFATITEVFEFTPDDDFCDDDFYFSYNEDHDYC